MKISLITVCYNSEGTIEETLKSVLNQTYGDYEYIIVDGKSSDGTLKILEKYKSLFGGKMRYHSEKDEGLYDAMNKGIKVATGDVIGFLNADDKLSDSNVFSIISEKFKEKSVDGVYSDLLFLDKETMRKPKRKFLARPFSRNLAWHPPFPTLYLRRKIYKDLGYYNQKYRIAADFDFMLRLLKKGYKLSYIKGYFVYMRVGGLSTGGIKGYWNNFWESYKVLVNNKVKYPFLCNLLRTFNTIIQMLMAISNKEEIVEINRRE
jgi:glycosyltransferase involved in cell wall biosynthesis